MGDDTEKALGVLREIWAARGQDAPDEESCGTGKSCRKMADVGFDGLAGDGGDLRAAWRAQLAREGKLDPGAGSVRDLVLGR